MQFIGIDPGKKGGITILDERGEVSASHVMPIIHGKKDEYDLTAIEIILRTANDKEHVMCAVERSFPLPKQGVTSTFSIGYGQGILQGILTALHIPWVSVRAQEWQKVVLRHTGKGDTKQKSIAYAQQRFPNVDWRANDRCRTAHDGKTDSCAIARYAYSLQKI